MRSLFVLLLAVGACASSVTAPVQPPQRSTLEAFVAERFTAGQKRFPTPAVAVAVEHHGKLILDTALGTSNLEVAAPASRDLVGGIGSISKSLAAAAVLRLVEQGKLRLDDELTRYVPDYPVHGQRITLLDLLRHTSGIADYEYEGDWHSSMACARTSTQVIATFKDLPMAFASGTHWGYSSSNYYLLGVIIEKVAGKPLVRFLEEELYRPAGLAHTGFCDPAAIIPHRATGYSPDPETGALRHAALVDLPQFGLAGGLCSTTADLLAWRGALRTGKILTPASLALMRSAPALPDGTPTFYGMGEMVTDLEGHRLLGHTGGVPGYTASLFELPDDELTIAVLSNSDSPLAVAMAMELATELLHLPALVRRPETPEALARLPGYYRAPVAPFVWADVVVDADHLALADGQARLELFRLPDGTYATEERIWHLRFAKDGQAAVGNLGGETLVLRRSPRPAP